MTTIDPPDAGRLRVVHVITRMIVGGAQENTLESCARVSPEVVDSTLVSGPQTGAEGSLLEETTRRGVRLVVEATLRREIAPWHDLRALVRLTRLLRAERPAVVHTHSSKAGILGRAAARLAGVPVVVHTVHGWGFHDHQHPAVRRAYVLAERLAARWSDALVVVADSDRAKGRAEGIGRPEQYRLIRSGVDLDPFRAPGTDRAEARRRLGVPVEGPLVGAVGRLSPQKDPLALVRVLARLVGEHPGLHAAIVGDGPLRAEVEALAADLGVADRLVLPGLRRDVAQILPAFDALAFTSGWEGLPRVIPQAMAAGVPIASYAVDGAVEALGEGPDRPPAGLLVESGDEEGLAKALSSVLADPDLAATLADRGRAASHEFDLSGMIDQLTALYAEQLAAAANRQGDAARSTHAPPAFARDRGRHTQGQ